jgi:Zn-dependent protease
VLAGAAWLVISAGGLSGVADTLLNIFFWANLVIGIFNVLPGLPLDGGRLVESAVWKATGSHAKGTVAAGWGGRIIVIALGLYFIVRPLLSGDVPDTSMLLITILVGGFLWMGASASIQQGRLRSRLHLVSAAALAEPAVGLSETVSVSEVLNVSAGGRTAVRRTAGPAAWWTPRPWPRCPPPWPAPPPPGRWPTRSAPAPTCRNGPKARSCSSTWRSSKDTTTRWLTTTAGSPACCASPPW